MSRRKPKGGKLLTGNNSPTSPRMISAAERQRKAIELRLAGCTFEEIAQALGYSGKGAAFKAVTKGLENSPHEPADSLRKLHRRRLERFLRSWFPSATQANNEGVPHEGAADKCLKVLQQIAALEGLNSSLPTHHEHKHQGNFQHTHKAEDLTDEQLAAIIVAGSAGDNSGSVGNNSV
jgi:hypothetical protein